MSTGFDGGTRKSENLHRTTQRRHSCLRVRWIFESRVSELATGKSPEAGGWKAGVTDARAFDEIAD
jgi:hypothetical protein